MLILAKPRTRQRLQLFAAGIQKFTRPVHARRRGKSRRRHSSAIDGHVEGPGPFKVRAPGLHRATMTWRSQPPTASVNRRARQSLIGISLAAFLGPLDWESRTCSRFNAGDHPVSVMAAGVVGCYMQRGQLHRADGDAMCCSCALISVDIAGLVGGAPSAILTREPIAMAFSKPLSHSHQPTAPAPASGGLSGSPSCRRSSTVCNDFGGCRTRRATPSSGQVSESQNT